MNGHWHRRRLTAEGVMIKGRWVGLSLSPATEKHRSSPSPTGVLGEAPDAHAFFVFVTQLKAF